MEVIDHDRLLSVLKDLKSKRKTIGEFYTTGKIHEGHLAGLREAKKHSDIILVVFNYYLHTVHFQLIGRDTFPNYEGLFLKDIEILEKTKLVDYVTVIRYSNEIFEDVIKCRKLVLDELPELNKFEWFRKYSEKSGFFNQLIASLSSSIHMNPEEPLCDFNWFGDKNFANYLSIRIAKKNNIPIKFNFYPVVRGEDGVILDSRYINSEERIQKVRKDLTEIFKEATEKVINYGKIIDAGDENIVISLINQETLQSEKNAVVGQSYFLTMNFLGAGVTFFDTSRIYL